MKNCKSASFEHPGCLHITLDDGSGLVVGSSGLDWYAADPDTGEWDLGAGPTNSIGFPNNEELAAFSSPVESTSTEHTGGNQVSCTVEALLPVWDGAEWTETKTRNPAWAAAEVMRGSANARPLDDSRIDLDSLLEFASYCTSKLIDFDVYVDVIELESGAAVSVGCDTAIAWPTVADARRMLDGDESALDAALAVAWLFEA